MKTLLKAVIAAAAVLALGACAAYKEKAPAWMPGSNAVSVKLSGAEEVPPVKVEGSGSGTLRLAEDGSLSGSVTTTGVDGTMAHIHRGAKGQNGPVVVPLEKKGNTYSVPDGRKLTEAQMKDWKAGNLYVNVHTARHKGGEVRGQITP